MTQLIEFKNQKGEVLRGLVDKTESQKGIVFIHGFEGTTIEKKFRNIVDKLKGKANLFRFDFSGCGLSDGKFEDFTIGELKDELTIAIKNFKKYCSKIKETSLIAYSLGCCAALKFISKNPGGIKKIIFFSPALNQKRLLKYWIKKRAFNSAVFKRYFSENKNKDYQDLFKKGKVDFKNILIIHGDNDEDVPFETNDKLPQGIKIFKVAGGDHKLRRPEMIKQYLGKIVNFLSYR